MLYTLFNSPSSCNFSLLLNFLSKNDDLILIQDGILAGLHNSNSMKKIIVIKNKIPFNIFGIKNDIESRGLLKIISKKIIQIEYKDFVSLSIKNKQQIFW
ncbi:sulfurtransferase complex subunit TusB [Enterobacteriaceae endosymbiont of Plateumaris consimilis]|uniref:sulfurtransferase complex subunit TusB n=1 Tax=Enterobacteriaceae endosymbiont of Plateumaris consimilis TaxID=2675794 RepID=UPI001448D31D|nr:sulfurtransferase complex subunit TusB [Enterobacteriaceae endosymbiont of Plateumaris consimilis]QJC28732.1 sulfurtransferase complex subunit TusB [Enterobacteriaceae endosymbiont of Plateumaris consimilis]